MEKLRMIEVVKMNLCLETKDYDLVIADIIQDAQNYCNLEELPIELEPFVRRKAKKIIDYETVNGSGYIPEIESIKEGDGSITYVTNGASSQKEIYGMTQDDRMELRRYRRLRRND